MNNIVIGNIEYELPENSIGSPVEIFYDLVMKVAREYSNKKLPVSLLRTLGKTLEKVKAGIYTLQIFLDNSFDKIKYVNLKTSRIYPSKVDPIICNGVIFVLGLDEKYYLIKRENITVIEKENLIQLLIS
jgi:hypothetical protein